MNSVAENFLKALHKVVSPLFSPSFGATDGCILDPDEVSRQIYNLLTANDPCMIARYGSTELFCTLNYLSVSRGGFPLWDYLRDKRYQWWWNQKGLEQLRSNAGFFPLDLPHVAKFAELIIESSREIDLLGHWLPQERMISSYWRPNLPLVNILMLEPYWSSCPWTRALAGKNILVIHPFAELIEQQYLNHREQLFDNPDVLPAFKLKTIKAVQSIGGHCPEFNDWFQALDSMKQAMDSIHYDIALIGCGAYGMPLAAYAKHTGHKAIHLGGALQLLFGIRGRRWDDPQYGMLEFGHPNQYASLFNPFWIYPNDSYKPACYDQVEGGCYW